MPGSLHRVGVYFFILTFLTNRYVYCIFSFCNFGSLLMSVLVIFFTTVVANLNGCVVVQGGFRHARGRCVS